MREVNRSFSLLFFFFSIRYQTLISEPCLLFDRPEILSNLNFVYERRHSLVLPEYLQGGQQGVFFIVFCTICYQTLISDIDTFTLALFIV